MCGKKILNYSCFACILFPGQIFPQFWINLWHLCTEKCKPLGMPTYGLFSHIALHKKVLFAGGDDGILSQMVIKGDHALITAMETIGSSITSLCFNPSHHQLAISCSLVSCRFLFILYLCVCVCVCVLYLCSTKLY